MTYTFNTGIPARHDERLEQTITRGARLVCIGSGNWDYFKENGYFDYIAKDGTGCDSGWFGGLMHFIQTMSKKADHGWLWLLSVGHFADLLTDAPRRSILLESYAEPTTEDLDYIMQAYGFDFIEAQRVKPESVREAVTLCL